MFETYQEFESFARNAKTSTGKLFGEFEIKTTQSDPDVSYWIEKDGYWESFVSYKVANYFEIVKPAVCVDVGAHVGYYSLLFLWLGAKVVYAFEPNPVSFSALEETIRINNLYQRLIPHNLAVLDNNYDAVFLEDMFGIPNSYISNFGKYVVSSVSLDKFFYGKEYPDFVKIDAEGSEEKIISGMDRILKANHRLCLVVELAKGRGYDVLGVFRKLKDNFSHWVELLHNSSSETVFDEHDFFDVMLWR